jgi:hypothetical protein
MHSLASAIFHTEFWRIFEWKADLSNLSAANRAIVQVANLQLIYVLLAVAVACLFLPSDLLGTRLGHWFLGGMSVFWIGRVIEQFIFLRTIAL